MFEIFDRETRTAVGKTYDTQEEAQWQIDMNQKKYSNCYAKYKG